MKIKTRKLKDWEDGSLSTFFNLLPCWSRDFIAWKWGQILFGAKKEIQFCPGSIRTIWFFHHTSHSILTIIKHCVAAHHHHPHTVTGNHNIFHHHPLPLHHHQHRHPHHHHCNHQLCKPDKQIDFQAVASAMLGKPGFQQLHNWLSTAVTKGLFKKWIF